MNQENLETVKKHMFLDVMESFSIEGYLKIKYDSDGVWFQLKDGFRDLSDSEERIRRIMSNITKEALDSYKNDTEDNLRE